MASYESWERWFEQERMRAEMRRVFVVATFVDFAHMAALDGEWKFEQGAEISMRRWLNPEPLDAAKKIP